MFDFVCYVLGFVCLGKGLSALLIPSTFYKWRLTTHYEAKKVPPIVFAMPLLMVSLAILSIYAIVTQYQPWSWIVTGFTCVMATVGITNLANWSRHRKRLSQAIESETEKRFLIDVSIVALGVAFWLLATFVYD